MTDFHATVKSRFFAAAALATSKDKGRPYLQGVYIEPSTTNGGVNIFATDGRVLFFAHDEDATASRAALVMPPAHKMAKKWMKVGTLELDSTLAKAGNEIADAPEMGRSFPDYRRVMPEQTSGEVAQFNSEYVATMGTIGKVIGCQYPKIYHNGLDPALVDFGDQPAFGVIMPLRENAHSYYNYDRLLSRVMSVKNER